MASVFAQRASYQRQGIRFVGGPLPLSSERRVSDAFGKKLSRDYLFVDDRESDFIGTWRGSRVQLYAVSPGNRSNRQPEDRRCAHRS
ncbi:MULTISPECIES: hypothetical protein [unclassified Rhodococcus (in: high G+C Gram-positive bacteria)]|uniref:hypothetical protein n=1 Tax=unclassified Rhodococcus (in: high G+C Gram-positive bacteria) TaxID=192944 RepID=UPI000ABB7065|nr:MULTISPECIES: hypothetical protein [unclassified Rhodococcus (in: high G+C Gram-positive bacteria)]